MKVFGKPTLKDLFELSKDPTITVSSTPFGANIERGEKQLYLKRAVPWKGVKGIENLRRVNPRVAETIDRLRAISQNLRIKGAVIVRKNDGTLTKMPLKAVVMRAPKDPGILERIVTVYEVPRRVSLAEYEGRVMEYARMLAQAT